MAEALEAIRIHGSNAAAARALGIPENTLRSRVKKAREALGDSRLSGELQNLVADGFQLKAYSHYTKTASGEPIWVKASTDQNARADALRAAADAMAGEIAPCAPVTAPEASRGQLLTLYTFSDYHVGMLAWHREGGADWDLAIAEDMGVKAMVALTDAAPASSHAIVNIQGDFLHFDGLSAVTPTSGHLLDADGRFGKVVDVAIRLIRQLVAQALSKHQSVTLLITEGNHDLASSLWLRKLFAALYENEPRLTVHDSELPYYAIRWGNQMLGFHHGHLKKNAQLPALFAAQFRQMWGECSKVAIHTGHLHHREVIEHTGAEVIMHPTLAARDAYAARGGWFGERRLIAYTYHKAHGEVGTHTVSPEMLS